MFGSRVTDQDILTGQLRAMKHAIEALENARDILELADSPWVLVKAESAIVAAHKAKDRLQRRIDGINCLATPLEARKGNRR